MSIRLSTKDKVLTINKQAPYSAFINYLEGYPEQIRVNADGTHTKVVTAIIMGQSELEHFMNSSSYYSVNLEKPQVSNANMTVILQKTDSSPIVVSEVTQETIDSGAVSPSMGALAEVLGKANPDIHYVIGDACVGGTSRAMLADDTDDENPGADGFKRYWSDFTNVVDYINDNYGHVMHVIENWYNADAAYVKDLPLNYWPFYFGVDKDGNRVEIGSTIPLGITSYQLDHILWDADAPANELGRGIFRKDQTSWHILTPMPYNNGAETSPEDEQFTIGERNEEPTRQNIHALESNDLAKSVRLKVGPSTHIADYEGDIHPAVDDPDGVVLFGLQHIPPLIRISRSELHEPQITAVSCPDSGEYADVEVSLPNGGELSTLRQLRGISMPVPQSPHQQTVTGFEVFRSSQAKRRPVFNSAETTYPEVFRGSVEIVDAGSGTPKTGKVRITPDMPFEYADSISYLRGQATALLRKDRDVANKLFLDMIVEHIPALYDPTAMYPYEGVAVKPKQSDIILPIPAPPFIARGAYFDGSSGFVSTGSVPYNGAGTVSLWLNNKAATWEQNQYIFQFRKSGTTHVQFATTSSNRLAVRLRDNGAQTTTLGFYAAADGTGFELNKWYHVAFSWNATQLFVYVNGALVMEQTFTSIDSETLNQFGFISESAFRNNFNGDIGHLLVNLNQFVDFSDPLNIQKLTLNGNPVDLSGNGSALTQSTPTFYFDGDAKTFNNKGTFGAFPLTGSLTASVDSPGYEV